MKLRAALVRRPSVGGAALGLVAWWLSLPPTLLPRSWFTQGVISAVCLATGYMVGTFGGFLVHRVLADRHVDVPAPVRRRVHQGVAGLWVVAVLASLLLWTWWQNQQRELVGLDDLGPLTIVLALVLTAVLTLILGLGGRLFHHGVALVDRFFHRRGAPRYLANLLTAGVVTVAIWALTVLVLAPGFQRWADDQFGPIDEGTEPGVEAPSAATVSGSPDSLVAWDSLGLQGRSFVAQAPTPEELAAFAGSGAEAKAPIRVYAGIDSEADIDARAALVVAELERTNAFSRSVLVVFTATGTGWVDPAAAASLEYMHGGDTAIASMQYSFFPSWISFLIDGQIAEDAGLALYDAVHARWLEEPEATRPELIVFGQSLGSFGAETPFAGDDAAASVEHFLAGADGYFFTGPTHSNVIWSQLTAAREPGSPSWRPVYDGGRTVRLINRPSDLDGGGDDWAFPRVLYVHHPSDPVGTWTWSTLWSSPDWVDHPVGYDVPPGVRWWPFVTFVQEVGDLIQGFSAPVGYGHDYTNIFVPGWAAVAPADGWTDADSQRLLEHLGHLE